MPYSVPPAASRGGRDGGDRGGSVDVSRCGYRYNSFGISRRYRCNECLRKFSLKYNDTTVASQLPSEVTWLLAEIGMVLNKLEDLMEAFAKLTHVEQLPVGRTIAEQSIK